MDEFEWDEAKAAKCFAERKISFQDAASALLGVTITSASHREGEARFASICECNGLIIVWFGHCGARAAELSPLEGLGPMNGKGIVRRSAAQLKPGESDWAALDAMSDEDIDRQIREDPDAAPILDDEWFSTATIHIPTKTATSMRIDSDVMDWFRAQGRGWQTKMNAVLRAYVRAHGGVK